MYLKSLELNGFKSFAEKTRLMFEPGMTSIVGPNGCGKSNIADAVRWVLGEQSAKALRGSKMEDCIFNGTDDRKPMGMAEVSVTFSDCEKVLQTEFHEITITRRVLRSGEGQYFINKTPCRLKDIQRMFMDTGIGTTSYSLLEQGRIDQVLSSRPEDRRTIFEEASGITKFKADKKEAIRKLEQTEANLIRLADVIREVRRQIGSLRRQAGKAQRYKLLRQDLRKLDIHLTRTRLNEADRDITRMENRAATLADQVRTAQTQVTEMEQGTNVLRDGLSQTEREIASTTEESVKAHSRIEHTREMIAMNRQRVQEYRDLARREATQIDETQALIGKHEQTLVEQAGALDQARAQREEASAALTSAQAELDAHRDQTERVRVQVRTLREESVEQESRLSHLQNRLVEIESHERSDVIRRERLAAEKSQLQRTTAAYESRQAEMREALVELQKQVETTGQRVVQSETQIADATRRMADLQQEGATLQSKGAACSAQIDLLCDAEAEGEGYAEGSRLLLDEANPLGLDREKVLGALASHVQAAPGHAIALQAVLRAWVDAVVVSNAAAAREVLKSVMEHKCGSARLVSASGDSPQSPSPADNLNLLIQHVTCSEPVRPALQALIGNVLVVDTVDAVPDPLPSGHVFVTRDGAVLRGDGSMEVFRTEAQSANPMARRQAMGALKQDLAAAEAALRANQDMMLRLKRERESLDVSLSETRAAMSQALHALAQKEGETQVVGREAEEAGQRLETVTWELDDLAGREESGDSEKRTIASDIETTREQRMRNATRIAESGKEIESLESKYADINARVTDRRVRYAEVVQKIEHLESQHASIGARLEELRASLQGRSQGVLSYEDQIRNLEETVVRAEQDITKTESTLGDIDKRAEELKMHRSKQAQELEKVDKALAARRTSLEELREARAEIDLHLSEERMRHDHHIERVSSEYSITRQQIDDEPPPVWEGEMPTLEQIETTIAELRAKIEAMGPVNLVAIEEYDELEKRHEFLTGQEQDLVNAKRQLEDMIRQINRTTSEMFRATFEQVNLNFQEMFTKLFNGGQAKLVLVNEDDVLECGIEIIARPPGKRLQNVSLLSGGERTLTAVALLFSIYLIKPSPFCMLDELDAALDESNIGRFVSVLREFLGQSQFVVITHNRQTIAAADVLYGVTMQRKGISNIVSMRFTESEAATQPEEVTAPART